MNGKELFLGLSYINRKYIDEAENDTVCICANTSLKKHGDSQNNEKHIRFRKPLLMAPVVAMTRLLVGDGPDRVRLEGAAAGLGLTAPDVVFAGMVPAEQVADWYQLGDLFVSASTSETQGLTYVEALAAGVPVLCRADPCLEGVIREGENGWTYRDSAEFQRKLALFQSQPHHHAKMAELARRSAGEFSLQRFAERAEAIYRLQIARRGNGAEEAGA